MALIKKRHGVLSVEDIVKIVNAVDSARRLLEDVEDVLRKKGWNAQK